MEDSQLDLKVIYDLSLCPEGLNIDNLFNIMKNGGIIIYDSSRNPDALPPSVLKEGIKPIDVAFFPKELFEEKFRELMKEKDPFFSYKEEDGK